MDVIEHDIAKHLDVKEIFVPSILSSGVIENELHGIDELADASELNTLAELAEPTDIAELGYATAVDDLANPKAYGVNGEALEYLEVVLEACDRSDEKLAAAPSWPESSSASFNPRSKILMLPPSSAGFASDVTTGVAPTLVVGELEVLKTPSSKDRASLRPFEPIHGTVDVAKVGLETMIEPISLFFSSTRNWY